MRTLGGPLFALLQQAEGGAVPEGTSTSIVRLLGDSSPISKVVLLILAIFSIVSWSVILYKLWTFRRAARQSASFLDVFRRSNKFSEVQAVCRSLNDSPLVGLFQAGYTELTTQLRQPGGVEATQLRVAEQYVKQFGELAKAGNTVVLPANVADVASMVTLAMKVFKTQA